MAGAAPREPNIEASMVPLLTGVPVAVCTAPTVITRVAGGHEVAVWTSRGAPLAPGAVPTAAGAAT